MKRSDNDIKSEWRQIASQGRPVETGPVRFGDDYMGVFIRGDNAFYYRMYLENIRNKITVGSLEWYAVTDMIELFASADEQNMLNPKGSA